MMTPTRLRQAGTRVRRTTRKREVRTMRSAMKGWVVVGILIGTMAYAIAEEITLTTYYPSPRGVYEELQTRETTLLATSSGNVGIGHASAASVDTKLDVSGDAKVRNNLAILGTIAIQGGSPAANRVLTAVDSAGNAVWDVPRYQ